MYMEDRAAGALVGLAVGDAVGTTLEFETRGSFTPITDMVGGGPFQLQAGQWTDDTSMALCLGHSLLYQNGFDATDQMNRYCNWYQYGYLSSNGHCFDIGITVSSALRRYLETKDPFSGPTDPYSSGNGSIMRLAPIPLFYSQDLQQCLHFAGESSRTTHGSQQCVDACRLFAQLLFNAMRASSKAEIFSGLHSSHYCQEVAAIAQGDFLADSYEQMHGSGYVIDSLKSALWCFNQGKDFKDAVLLAANIGNDADTTAAICGQIAGAFYGFSQIPADWRSRITLADDIKQLALGLLAAGQARQGQPA